MASTSSAFLATSRLCLASSALSSPSIWPSITPAKTEIEAFTLGAHLLHAVDVADGVVAKNAQLEPVYRTARATLKSPSTGLFMWRSYSNSRWQSN
jgi:hypothetical protein